MKIRIFYDVHIEHFHKNNFHIEDVRKSKYLQEKLKRPGYHDTFCFRFLNDEIHDWLIEYDIQYKIYWTDTSFGWCLEIEDPAKAAFFKLTWI